MALNNAAGVASTALSPAPLTPMGENGDGVSVYVLSVIGTSQIVGSK